MHDYVGTHAGSTGLSIVQPCNTLVLCEFHWLPVGFWVQFKVLIVTFKTLQGMEPDYLHDCLSSIVSVHSNRLGRIASSGSHQCNTHWVGARKHPSLSWHLSCGPTLPVIQAVLILLTFQKAQKLGHFPRHQGWSAKWSSDPCWWICRVASENFLVFFM